MKYKFLNHTADIKFQAFGKSLEECFENAGYALFEIMFEKIKIKPKIKREIKIKGSDLNNLLYNFLEEFLYLLDAENFIVGRIDKINIDKKKLVLTAELFGDKAENYRFSNSVKAITYNDMFIRKNFQKNRLPLAEARGLIGDFSSTGKFFGMLGNDRILKDAVFNVPDIKEGKEKFICQVVVDV